MYISIQYSSGFQRNLQTNPFMYCPKLGSTTLPTPRQRAAFLPWKAWQVNPWRSLPKGSPPPSGIAAADTAVLPWSALIGTKDGPIPNQPGKTTAAFKVYLSLSLRKETLQHIVFSLRSYSKGWSAEWISCWSIIFSLTCWTKPNGHL